VCHLEGVGGAPVAPSEPDHSAFEDARTTCTACHSEES
jgi:predicted CxxxxCH...CXXCH cytochrome family protein